MTSYGKKGTSERLTVLVIGGYGTFGSRLVRLLANESRLKLMIAGRSYQKAKAFCESLVGEAELFACVFDREKDVLSQLKGFSPDMVVDASGPFQTYGNTGYAVVEACLDLGIDYIDLADGRKFVLDIEQYDEAAKKKQIFVLSGASTCPALTCAVIRKLATSFQTVESFSAGIAPSPQVAFGDNVIRAILSYAGKSLDILQKGKWVRSYALINSRNYQIDVPGHLPLRKRRFSLIDVPDIQIIARHWPEIKNIWFGVGTEPKSLHKLLNLLSWSVRLGLVSSLSFATPIVSWVKRSFKWGAHRGGMFVKLEGRDQEGQLRQAKWHLIAEKDDGPFIPSMASAALIRKCLKNKSPKKGARPAHHELELSDFEAFFKAREIFSYFQMGDDMTSAALYPQVLQQAYQRLPKQVRKLHDFEQIREAEGQARVTRGRNILSRAVGWLFGFPPAGENVSVRLRLTSNGKQEIWERWFGGHHFKSTFRRGKGRFKGHVIERLGAFNFAFALLQKDVERNGGQGSELHMILTGWTVAGFPMPLFLGPKVTAYEFEAEGKFNFYISVALPLVGPVVHYDGWLGMTKAE